MNRACAIQSNANLPPSLWGKCIRAAGYLKNIATTRTLRKKTPYEAWYNKLPDVSHLHKIGCKAWVFVMDNNPKIYNRSVPCIRVSYSNNLKAYRCWDRTSSRIHVTRNVVFTESQDMAMHALHPGIVVNNEDTVDIDEDSHRNTKGTTDSLSPSEGLLGHLGQQTANDLE